MSLASRLGTRFRTKFIASAISAASGAILLVILARLLDPSEYGLLYLAISVFGTLKLFSKLGIAKSAARYISEYKETNQEQIKHIIRFSLFLNLIMITIVSLVLFIGREHIAFLVGEPDLRPLLLFGILFIGFSTMHTFSTLILQGFEAIQATGVISIFHHITRLIFAIGLVVIGYGVIGALMGYIAGYAVAAVTGLGYVFYQYYRHSSSGPIEPGLRRRIAEYSIPITATDTAGILDKRIDIVLVGFFIGPVAVAYYTLGKQIITFIESPITALGFTLSPTYESLSARGDRAKAARIYEEALRHGLLLYIPAAAGLALVAEPTVELVFGADYQGAVPVIQVLSLYAVLMSVTKLTSNGLDFLGRAKTRAVVKGATAVLNVALNILLIPTIGVVGAAIATVITYSLYTFANVYIMHSELGLRIKVLFRHITLISAITSVMVVVVYLLTNFITGFITLFTVVAVGAGIWAVLAVGTGLLEIKKVWSVLS
ncbi:flippase [Natronococcus sp. A-GB1]|uniref:flippase n=1 Tax=Natronococcus sp. A-GB1 TaxID=3037648 RepID=UPI00241E619F|nr:flippase [Natronococcus sp. A-GB1]MDG5761549.1 flippase [Natronococcus sp. A-GB1]